MTEWLTCPTGHRWPREGAESSSSVCSRCGKPAIDRGLATPPLPSSWADDPGEIPTKPPDTEQIAAHAELPPAALPDVPGYDVLRELGKGGMGVVHLARQHGLDRLVALKMIRHGESAGPDEVARFHREARALAQLAHPFVVKVHEVGELRGCPFFSLEFISGGSLDRRLAGTPQPAAVAAALVEKVAQGVHAAHQAGIIHRDLKPGNVLIEEGPDVPLDRCTPRVSDFGLARKIDSPGSTQSGAIVGTPSYMSPEQATGQTDVVGPLSDVYALGAILYECLTGRPPFKAASTVDTLMQVAHDEPVPPRRLQPAVPPDLETVCLTCLNKDPRKRYASAQALADDLGRFQRGEPVRARPIGNLQRGWRWAKRNPRVAGLGAAVFLLVVAVAVVASVMSLYLDAARKQADQNAENEKEAKERALAAEKRAEAKAEDEARARQDAETAQEDAETAQVIAVDKEREAQEALYIQKIALTSREWQLNHVQQVHQLLEDCAPERRGWEWRHLHQLAHAECRLLAGHVGPVIKVAWSADGKRIASASEDRTVKVWDTATGQVTRTFRGHSRGAYGVAFSPDSKWVASAGSDGRVLVWDAESGKVTLDVKDHPNGAIGVAFSSDGKRLVSSGGHMGKILGGEVIVREWPGDKVLYTLPKKEFAGPIACVTFSPDDSTLATADWGQQIRLWDTKTGKAVRTLGRFTGNWASFSPDSKQVVTSGSLWNTPRLWDASTGQELKTLPRLGDGVRVIAFNPKAAELATSGSDKVVRIWDLKTGLEKCRLRGHTGFIWALAWAPDGKSLVTAGEDRALRVWRAEGQGPHRLDQQGRVAYRPAFSPDRKHLATSSGDKVALWDLGTRKLVRDYPGRAFAFNGDGSRLATADKDHVIRILELSTGKELLKLEGHTQPVGGLAWGGSGRWLASAAGELGEPSNLGVAGEVFVWDLGSGKLLHRLKGHEGPVSCVAFQGKGDLLASGGEDRAVRLWDAERGELLRALPDHSGPVRGVAFSPDGKSLACACGDPEGYSTLLGRTAGEAWLWDAQKGQSLHRLVGHSGPVNQVAFGPKGDRLFTSSEDGSVKVWDVKHGQELVSLDHRRWDGGSFGEEGSVGGLAISPDDQLLAASADGKICLWPAPFPPVTSRILRGHKEVVFSLEFHPGHRLLASAGRDGGVGIWDADSGRRLDWFSGKTPVFATAFSPDGKILASGGLDLNVTLRESQTGRVICTLKGQGKAVTSIAFCEGGKQLVTAELDGTLRSWEVETGKLLRTFGARRGVVFSLALAPDGKTLAAPGPDGTLILHDVSTGKSIRTLQAGGSVAAVRFDRDGKRLAACTAEGALVIWELASGKKVLELPRHLGGITALAYSPDARHLAVAAGDDGIVRLLNPDTGKETLSWRGHVTRIWSLTFSQDGKRLATGCVDGSIQVSEIPDASKRR